MVEMNWRAECERNRSEVYKALLRDAREQNRELMQEIAEEQSRRVITEFRYAESENHKKLAQIQNETANRNRELRENGKALRRCGTAMALAMAVMAIIMYLALILPGNKTTTAAMLVCMGCIGTALGIVLNEVARRITV